MKDETKIDVMYVLLFVAIFLGGYHIFVQMPKIRKRYEIAAEEK